MAEPGDAPPAVVARLRELCGDLPEAYEEAAWVGRRWRLRRRTFAHVLTIDRGWPPAYARAAGDDGPACVLTFRAGGPELVALRHSGRPFFAPPWRVDEVGMVLDDDSDWQEVAELVIESYCLLAPRKLADRVQWPDDG